MNTAMAKPVSFVKDLLRKGNGQWKTLYFVVFFTVLLTPQLSETIGSGALLAMYLGCLALGFVKKCRVPASALFGLAYFAVAIAYAVLGISTAAWGNYYQMLLVYTFPFIADVFFKELGIRKNPWIVTVLLLVISYNAIYNFALNVAIPGVSSLINFETTYHYLHPGGTLFAFQLLLVLMLLIPFYKYSRHRLLMAFTLFVSAACFLMFQRAIFALGLAFFLFAYWVFRKKTIGAATLLKAVYIVAGLVLIAVLLDTILAWLMQVIPGERLRMRISGTLQFMTSGTDDTNSFSNRWALYLAAIQTFTRSIPNFLFGVGYHTGSLDLAYLVSVGGTGHSEILDVGARYGMVGLLPFAGFFISLYREMQRRYRGLVFHGMDMKMMIRIMFAVIVYCALLNGIRDFGAMMMITVLSRLVISGTIGAEATDYARLEAREIA